MKTVHIKNKTYLSSVPVVEGERIETKVTRITKNNEPIKDGAPIIYTERKDGVKAEHDIRTDRFDIAVAAMDTENKNQVAKRMERIKQRETKKTEGQSIQGTEPAQTGN